MATSIIRTLLKGQQKWAWIYNVDSGGKYYDIHSIIADSNQRRHRINPFTHWNSLLGKTGLIWRQRKDMCKNFLGKLHAKTSHPWQGFESHWQLLHLGGLKNFQEISRGNFYVLKLSPSFSAFTVVEKTVWHACVTTQLRKILQEVGKKKKKKKGGSAH